MSDIERLRKKGDGPIFWKGRILNAKFCMDTLDKPASIEVKFGSPNKTLKVKMEHKLGNFYPPLIPYQIRFPFPRLIDGIHLHGLPMMGKGIGRHRKENWPINLLVYELSEAGMKNMEIARLLFGVEKSTEFRPDEIKHPILVKIAKIKDRVEGYVSEIYPKT